MVEERRTPSIEMQSLIHSPGKARDTGQGTLILLSIDLERGVAVVDLHDPERFNTITDTLGVDMTRAISHLSRIGGIRALTLQGAGSTFCAGGNQCAHTMHRATQHTCPGHASSSPTCSHHACSRHASSNPTHMLTPSTIKHCRQPSDTCRQPSDTCWQPLCSHHASSMLPSQVRLEWPSVARRVFSGFARVCSGVRAAQQAAVHSCSLSPAHFVSFGCSGLCRRASSACACHVRCARRNGWRGGRDLPAFRLACRGEGGQISARQPVAWRVPDCRVLAHAARCSWCAVCETVLPDRPETDGRTCTDTRSRARGLHRRPLGQGKRPLCSWLRCPSRARDDCWSLCNRRQTVDRGVPLSP